MSVRPDADPLRALREAARDCRACDLWKIGTQTVFGEGGAGARLLFVGEQPGDEEDRRGRPFVGPAGQLLDRALAAAGIDRSVAYVTNAVKHFKWTPRGKRRIHKTPAQKEIAACHQWLEQEIDALRPEVIVCLGRTAAQSVLGKAVTIGAVRGRSSHGSVGRPSWSRCIRRRSSGWGTGIGKPVSTRSCTICGRPVRCAGAACRAGSLKGLRVRSTTHAS